VKLFRSEILVARRFSYHLINAIGARSANKASSASGRPSNVIDAIITQTKKEAT